MKSMTTDLSLEIQTKKLNEVCPKCGEHLFTSVHMYGKDMVVSIICKCQKEAREKKKTEQANKEKQERLDKLLRNSLMDNAFRNKTFENWDFNKGSKQMYDLGLRYAKYFKSCKDKRLGLLIHGTPGNGKTYLAFCIANELLNNFIPVMPVSINSILGRIKETYNKYGNEAEEDIIRVFKNAEFLIIDDLGTEVHTDWSVSMVYNIIDERYRQGLPLAITTNIELKNNNIAKIYGERTEDRILEMCTPIEYKADSIRAKIAKSNTKTLRDILYKDKEE